MKIGEMEVLPFNIKQMEQKTISTFFKNKQKTNQKQLDLYDLYDHIDLYDFYMT